MATANIAARRPLLLTVDDLHWCDLPSLRWLAYLLPRIEGLDLLVVVGLRGEERGEDSALVGQIVSDPLAAILRPAPLSDKAATQLVREALSPDAEVCAACRDGTGGNPLLLRELVHEIVATGLAPTGKALWPGVGEQHRRLLRAAAVGVADADSVDRPEPDFWDR